MKVLLTAAEGYMLSEVSKLIYSPGFSRPDLPKTEHEVIVDIIKLVEARLQEDGIQVLSKKYDEQRNAEYQFDKAKHSIGCDAAIMIALNNSPNPIVQFSTCLVHQQQVESNKLLFEGFMWALGRYVAKSEESPIPVRYPNSLKRIPYLDTCRRNNTPAICVLPFYYTDKSLTVESLGQLIESTALAITEGILTFHPDGRD